MSITSMTFDGSVDLHQWGIFGISLHWQCECNPAAALADHLLLRGPDQWHSLSIAIMSLLGCNTWQSVLALHAVFSLPCTKPSPGFGIFLAWRLVQQYNLDVQTPGLFLEDLGGIRMIRMLECLIHTDSIGWCGDWRSCMVSPATRQGAVELQIGNFDLLKDFLIYTRSTSTPFLPSTAQAWSQADSPWLRVLKVLISSPGARAGSDWPHSWIAPFNHLHTEHGRFEHHQLGTWSWQGQVIVCSCWNLWSLWCIRDMKDSFTVYILR